MKKSELEECFHAVLMQAQSNHSSDTMSAGYYVLRLPNEMFLHLYYLNIWHILSCQVTMYFEM